MRLTELDDHYLPGGTIFRFPGGYPYEPIVEFLLATSLAGDVSLVVLTGHYAGVIPQVLPPECWSANGLSVSWLRDNWQKWVWPQCLPADVEVLPSRPAPDTMSG